MKTENKICQNCHNEFVIEPEDFAFYEKMKVPAPTFCPECRQQKRILIRNFRTLYKRISNKSGKSILSMFSEKTLFPVWSHDEWWSDDWDAKIYGRDVDFTKSFFSQIKALWDVVPRSATIITQSVGCDYSNAVLNGKNLYLVFGTVDCENCIYGHIVWNSKDCVDGLYVFKSELCYECVDVLGSYYVLYSQECEDCNNCIGIFDCRGCSNCIGCVGLRQKSNYLFNEFVGKEKIEEFLKEHPLHDLKTISMILEKRGELRYKVPQKYFSGSHNINVSGDHIYHAKNVHNAFDVKSGEDSKFIFVCRKTIDSYDISFTADIELGYQNVHCFGRNIMFSSTCVNCTYTYYSENCTNCHNIFGCEGLKSEEYCILNKKYSKQEYEVLLPKLIKHMEETGEWGNFFPKEILPFAYNESIVNEYFPMTKEKALEKGYKWEDNIPRTKGQTTIKYEELPKNPKLFLNEITEQVLECNTCKCNYRLTTQEIAFYKRIGIRIPHECFNCRHEKRMKLRNAHVLFNGHCAKCNVKFETSYNLDQQKQYMVYCEQCYQQEVV
jgi:hypothetical protein